MHKPTSDPEAPLVQQASRLHRYIRELRATPAALGALGVLLVLVIASDLAARAGSLPFLVLIYLHARSRKVPS